MAKNVSQRNDGLPANFDEDRFLNLDISVERKGSKIVLPNDPHEMNYDEAILALERKKKEESQLMVVAENVQAFPLDGALALQKALATIYGWANAVPTPGFWGSTPPAMVGLETGVNETTQVIWGSFSVPNIEGLLSTDTAIQDGRLIFQISGQVRKSSMPAVKKIAELTRRFVKEQSVYRGKAIHLRVNDQGKLDTNNPPKFLDLTKVNREELVFSDQTMRQIQTNLFTPIQHADLCREHKIPLKRGILLSGPYGTGKTLTAFVAAQLAEENGWTFILIDRVKGLQEAINFARQYQPAVIFAEDIDRAISGETRTVEIDDILNTIDGIGSKGAEIITILTTNHVETINKAMLRPGRLDAVVTVEAPDAKAAEKLVRMYGRGLIPADEDLSEAGQELSGNIPAVIREVTERAKLYAIGNAKPGEPLLVTGADIADAARGMKRHMELLMDRKVEPKTPHERLGHAVADVLGVQIEDSGVNAHLNFIRAQNEKIWKKVANGAAMS